MCGTMNKERAQSCKYCGYLFEDPSNQSVWTSTNSGYPPSQQKEEQPPSSIATIPPASASDGFHIPPSSTTLSGSPLFVVSKPLLASILPSIGYLVFFLLLSSITTISFDSIALIAVFVLILFLPVLFTPRKYEFYDSSVRIHKTIGGDSEILYSEMAIYDRPIGRRPKIFLSVPGRRGPMAIPGNPMNKELGEDLNQFLRKKVKKYTPQSGNQQKSTGPSDADTTMSTDDDTAMS